jgi:CTP:molybdopterin cytidylyltransferase MocA
MTVAGVVLAAGRSRRMGTPKALLKTANGQTFLDSLAASLRQGGCQPVLAVVSEPVDVIGQACRLEGIQLIVNPDPDRGQISSVLLALDAVPHADGLLVCLVDQGIILVDTVHQVMAALVDHSLAVARYRGAAGHPTAFSRSVFDALRSEKAGHGGARVVVDDARQRGQVAWVDVDDPGVVRNLNTPEDYDAFSKTV